MHPDGAETEEALATARELIGGYAPAAQRFAAEHGLPPGQLHYWVYAPPTAGPTIAADAPVFQEVRLTANMPPRSGWAAEIALPGGTTVRLREGAAPEWAVALIQALGGPCSR